MAAKRKTKTSNEVKKRYDDKTFCNYKVMLRKVEDADLIAKIENLKQHGTKTSDAFKKIMRGGDDANKG